MQNEGKKIRFRNDGKKYVAEFITDRFISQKLQGTFVQPVVMIRIWDEHECNVVGCVTFTDHLVIDSVWARPNKKQFSASYRFEALVNLLHYLPLNPEKLREIHDECYEYRFDRDFGDDQYEYPSEDRLYRIKANDSFEATFQRVMFGGVPTNRVVQDAALEVMYNHWEDNPDTNVLVELLANILPVREVDLIKNLKLLLDEDKIRAVTEPSNHQRLISVGLKPATIRELEGELKAEVKYPQVVKHIYGTNIETTTHGDNSPVTINVGRIETFFECIQKEIEEHPDLKTEAKKEVSQVVKELETELTKTKDPKKVAGLVKKIQGSANWVWQKILSNPYTSGAIIELTSKALLG